MNWQQRYEELTKLAESVFEAKISDFDFLRQRIDNHIAETDRQRLREIGKVRLLRLKEDVSVEVEYATHTKQRSYKEGTLIDAVIRGNHAQVYLDDDGDGNMYFPSNVLEVVELNRDEVPLDFVVWQG